MVKFNYFSERPNKVKERFEIFLIDQWVIFEIKVFLVRNKKILVSVSPNLC